MAAMVVAPPSTSGDPDAGEGALPAARLAVYLEEAARAAQHAALDDLDGEEEHDERDVEAADRRDHSPHRSQHRLGDGVDLDQFVIVRKPPQPGK